MPLDFFVSDDLKTVIPETSDIVYCFVMDATLFMHFGTEESGFKVFQAERLNLNGYCLPGPVCIDFQPRLFFGAKSSPCERAAG